MRQWLAGQGYLVGQALFFSLIVGLIGLVGAGFMFEVYGRVLNSGNSRTLGMLLIAVLGAYILASGIEFVRSRILLDVARNFDQSFAPAVFRRLTDVALPSVGPTAGSQMKADCRTVRDFIASGNLASMLDLPVATVFLVGVCWIHPWLGALAAAAAVLQVLIIRHVERRTYPLLQAAFRAASGARAQFLQAAEHRTWIGAMGMRPRVRDGWLSRQAEHLRHHSAASRAHTDDIAATKSLAPVLNSLLLGAGCWLVVTGALGNGGGTMLVASILGGKVIAPLIQLTLGWRSVIEARAAWQRMQQGTTNAPPGGVPMPLPAPSGRLTVDRLDVAPAAGQKAVVRGIQFALAPGEVLLVLGGSGAGKSSLLRTLAGIVAPVAGTVRLDGADMTFWDAERRGAWMGYVAQDSQLLRGTILENITRFRTPDPRQLAVALEAADLTTWAHGDPPLLQRVIESGGAPLSGGERQRVALARALYGDVRLLILDEPNAHLDEHGERSLLNLLRSCRTNGITTVLTSHRPGVLPGVDKILAIQNGRQVAFGNRDDVRRTLEAARKVSSPLAVAGGASPSRPGDGR